MLISILIPSRLKQSPSADELLIERALRSIEAQTLIASGRLRPQVVIGADAGATVPESLLARPFIETALSHGRSQAAALNAAAGKICGEYVAILEDDDEWHPRFLEIALERLNAYAFISSNQIEIDANGRTIRIVDYPTPSGWVMKRPVWSAIGNFDESYRWHLDAEWLGRLNERRISRLHLIERSAPQPEEIGNITLADRLFRRARGKRLRSGLLRLSAIPNLKLERHDLETPLVTRLAHRESGHTMLKRDVHRTESDKEKKRMEMRFGYAPW